MPSKSASRSLTAHRSPGPAKAAHRPARSGSIRIVKKPAAKVPARAPAKAKAAAKPQPVPLKVKHPAVAKAAPKERTTSKVKPEAPPEPVKAASPAATAPVPVVAGAPPQPVAVEEPVVPAAKAPAAAPAPALQPVVEAEVMATVAEMIVETHVARPAPVELRRVPAAPAPRGFPTGTMRPGPGGGIPPGRPVVGLPPRPPAPPETFVEGDHVVYPTHGVGKIERIVTESIAGYRLELIHITFEENRMTLRVPVEKARSAGLRKLASRQLFDAALTTLRGRARIKRTMWSRRAQEYEAKINSGDPLAIAEVVRDLHRNAGQPDQSFSERQIYEAAMDRLAAELAALDNTDKATATEKLTTFMKSA